MKRRENCGIMGKDQCDEKKVQHQTWVVSVYHGICARIWLCLSRDLCPYLAVFITEPVPVSGCVYHGICARIWLCLSRNLCPYLAVFITESVPVSGCVYHGIRARIWLCLKFFFFKILIVHFYYTISLLLTIVKVLIYLIFSYVRIDRIEILKRNWTSFSRSLSMVWLRPSSTMPTGWGEIEPFSVTLAQDGLTEFDQPAKNTWNTPSRPEIEPEPWRGQTVRCIHSPTELSWLFQER